MMMDGVLPATNHIFFPNDAHKNEIAAACAVQN